MANRVEFLNGCKMLVKEIPPETRQLFLPLYLKHPAALKLRSAGLYLSGISDASPGFRIKRVPDFMFAVFTVRGHGLMKVGGHEWDLAPGSLFLAPMASPHEYFQTGKTGWHFLWFHLKPSAPWLQFKLSEPLLSKSRDAKCLENAMNGLAIEILADMHSLVGAEEQAPWTFYQDSVGLQDSLALFKLTPESFSGDNASQLAELHAGLILGYLQRELKTLLLSFGDDDTRRRFDSMWERINAELGKAWTLQELCAMVNMSVPTLIRQCRRCYDATPMQILYHMRLKRACELLLNGQTPVSAASRELGYENISSFSTAFKQEYGYSPREYRKRFFQPSEAGKSARFG